MWPPRELEECGMSLGLDVVLQYTMELPGKEQGCISQWRLECENISTPHAWQLQITL